MSDISAGVTLNISFIWTMSQKSRKWKNSEISFLLSKEKIEKVCYEHESPCSIRSRGCESGTGTFSPTVWSASPLMIVSTSSTRRAPSTGFYRSLTIPHPHIKAGHSLPIFEGEEKEGEIFCGGRYFPILALRGSRNCPKCSRCWKCAPCKDTISSDRPSLSHSFMPRSPIFFSVFYAFHLFTPEVDNSPFLLILQGPWEQLKPNKKVNNCPKKHTY